MPKYNALTNAYAEWLFPLIHRLDWSYRHPDGTVRRANLLTLIEDFGEDDRFPQKLTRTFLQKHLLGQDELHVFQNRKSGTVLTMIDIDAHEGQQDAYETARWIQSRYFPEAYLEASSRGYHLYMRISIGFCSSQRFNDLLNMIENRLQVMAMNRGYSSTIEFKGRLTIRDRISGKFTFGGDPFQAPKLPHGAADMKQLTEMPVLRPSIFKALDSDAALAHEIDSEMLLTDSDGQTPVYALDDCVRWNRQPKESACSWHRMKWACFDYTIQYRRLPEVNELLEHYQKVYQKNVGDEERTRRAKYAIRYRSRTYVQAKANDGGYMASRDRLLEAVKTFCLDRSVKYDSQITDEDLAIALYVFTRASFSVADEPKLQWTVGNNAISQMFARLKAEGVTKRGCNQRNKQVALKMILKQAGLIECLDRQYVVGSSNDGISKKWVISHNHWRHTEFIQFSQTVQVVYVDRIIKERQQASSEWKKIEAEKEANHVVNHIVRDEWAVVV